MFDGGLRRGAVDDLAHPDDIDGDINDGINNDDINDDHIIDGDINDDHINNDHRAANRVDHGYRYFGARSRNFGDPSSRHSRSPTGGR